MNIEFHPEVCQQLQQLPRPAFAAALRAIISLIDDPCPPGVRKLVGSGNDWRVRIGEYRVVYEIDDRTRTATVLSVRHRCDAYR